ncbi:alanine racemase [Clostridium tarantellae]|uniref:Alanine racemase n=1 Tax=Clostridium tarantellae TaxID=39493 RepID=A0A6I1MP69_9CLOT|nr:alanine racemase [Clostridium tarantellae]MPQ44583.1 alanine racemase [Clostridium tarantellae]
MEMNIRPVWAEIDLDAIAYNMKQVKNLVGNKEIMAVIKANAYGHGAIDIAPILLENGATSFAVAMITEAMELRHNNIEAPILILGYTPLEFAQEIIENDIEQTVYNLEYAKQLSNIAIDLGKKAIIHIAIDTGMGRIGFLPNKNSLELVKEICSLEGIEVKGLFTHFATSDEENKEYTYVQFSKLKMFYNELLKMGITIPLKHVANSGAIIDLPDTYLDAVRAGIILYGYYPSNEVKKDKLNLKPVLTLKTKVAHLKELDKNMSISYGRTFITSKKSKIATLPIGYADGYSRLLSGKAKVIINGHFANVIGKICMDQCMIDVSHIENVTVNDEVILIGEKENLKITVDDIAESMGTINYEVVCMLKKRIPRVYVKNGESMKIRNYI